MSRAQRWLLAVAVVTALVAGGASVRRWLSPDLAPGCAPPPHEGKLLDAYEHEPLMKIRPARAHRTDGPTRSQACRQWNREDTSNTMVSLAYRLATDLDVATLRALFDPVAARGGMSGCGGG